MFILLLLMYCLFRMLPAHAWVCPMGLQAPPDFDKSFSAPLVWGRVKIQLSLHRPFIVHRFFQHVCSQPANGAVNLCKSELTAPGTPDLADLSLPEPNPKRSKLGKKFIPQTRLSRCDMSFVCPGVEHLKSKGCLLLAEEIGGGEPGMQTGIWNCSVPELQPCSHSP